MPNNDNNNFELPNLNNQEEKPIIEIPKEYYEKLAEEKMEKEKAEAEALKAHEETKAASSFFGRLILLILVNAAVIFFLIRCYLTINEKLIIAIPVYIIVMAIIEALVHKKESMQSLAIMIGGMGVAVITFLLSAADSKHVDLWSYYAIASAITAFLGFILTSMITKVIADFKNVKALQSLGMVIFLIALVGVPSYLYQRNPEKAYRLIFQKKAEVKAETEDEYVLKTLNNRYNLNFICDSSSIINSVDQKNRSINQRLCYEESILKNRGITTSDLHERANEVENSRIIVTSIAYDESKTEYIVQDDYMDVVMLRAFEEKIASDLTPILSANKVILYLYPEENCSFIGNCAENDDYIKNHEKETDPENQFKNSSKLDFSKYITMDAEEFVNTYKFKYIFTVTSSNFGSEDTYEPAINQLLAELDRLGLKNTYGYVINLYNVPPENPLPMKVHQVSGDTNSKQTFSGA